MKLFTLAHVVKETLRYPGRVIKTLKATARKPRSSPEYKVAKASWELHTMTRMFLLAEYASLKTLKTQIRYATALEEKELCSRIEALQERCTTFNTTLPSEASHLAITPEDLG